MYTYTLERLHTILKTTTTLQKAAVRAAGGAGALTPPLGRHNGNSSAKGGAAGGETLHNAAQCTPMTMAEQCQPAGGFAFNHPSIPSPWTLLLLLVRRKGTKCSCTGVGGANPG